MKKLSLLGSTGSIGTQTLDVVRSLNRKGDFPIQAMVLAERFRGVRFHSRSAPR